MCKERKKEKKVERMRARETEIGRYRESERESRERKTYSPKEMCKHRERTRDKKEARD